MGTDASVHTYGKEFAFDIRNILLEGDLARAELFKWWLGNDPVFVCGLCEKQFSPVPSEIDEDKDVICAHCRRESQR